MTRRATRAAAYAPDPGAPGHACDVPGCGREGEYRAPKSPAQLRDYWWFCLEHVREYNSGWDFYRGMSPGQIEAEVRADTGWQRPTWPLGRLGHAAAMLRDPLELLRPHATAPKPPVPAELRQPLDTLGLYWPVSLDEVKARYHELAKRHHPDANGGDRGAEEQLKTINLAYAALRSHLGEASLART